jgi:hypothetical protein
MELPITGILSTLAPMIPPRLPLFVLCAFAALGSPASAVISVIASYRMGEADPGAAAGNPANTPAVDSAGGAPMGVLGSASLYSANTGVAGSSLSVDFSAPSGYGQPSPVITLTDNWGMEAWVQSDNAGSTSAIVYNGNSANSGMGLYQVGGNYIGLVGGLAFVGAAPITGTWTHLAMVLSGGVTTFYVNGVANQNGPTPNAPAGYFGIGVRQFDLGEQFDGRIDEVRLFRFNPGEFSPSDLQTGGVVPEPGLAALLAATGLAMVTIRRRC